MHNNTNSTDICQFWDHLGWGGGCNMHFYRPSPHVDRFQSRPRPPSSLVQVRVERHSAPRYAGMSFGCLNIRSLGNKQDDMLEVRRYRQIDVMFLTETWHDRLGESQSPGY